MEGRGTEHIKVVSQQTGTRNDEGSGPAPPRGGVGGEGQFCCEWPGVGSLAAGGVSSRTPISRNSPQPVCFGASLEPGRLCAGAPRGRRGPRPGAQACAETLGRPCLLENGRLHPPRGPHATPGTRGSAHAAGPSTLVPPGVLTPLSARRREARLRTAQSRVASSTTGRPAAPPRPASARSIQAASAWPSPAARSRAHPPRACTPAPHTGPSPLPSTLPRYLPGGPPGGSSVSAQTSPPGCEPPSPHLQTEHGLNPRALKSGSCKAPRAVAQQWAVVRPCLCAP